MPYPAETQGQWWYRNVYLKSPHWMNTRLAAKARANLMCEGCARPYNILDSLYVHHLTYANLWKERPEDLMVLCATCHSRIHLLWDIPPKEFSVAQLRIVARHFLYYTSKVETTKGQRNRRNHKFNKLPAALRDMVATAKKEYNAKKQAVSIS